MSLTVFRNNGVPVGGGTVTECETVRLRSSLEWQSECLIAGGSFRVGTVRAGNVFNSLSTVADPVPCLGAATVNADGCSVGQPTEVDTLTDIVYTVQAADIVGGTITFRASWEGGVLHQATPNVPGQSDQRQIVIPVQICNDNQFCNGVETCDPLATNGTQTGLCVPGITPCVDNLFCSNVVCNEATDSCDTTDISTTQCPDNLFCGTVACNEATDACDTTDISTAQCPDNLFCGNVLCDEASDSCSTSDISGTQCPDNLFCGTVACNEATDTCATSDVSATQCPDNLFCGSVACNEATDTCVTTDISATQCPPDNQLCGEVRCDEATDMCVSTQINCDDNNPCTTDVCDPVRGCVSTAIVCPDDGNPCTAEQCNPQTGMCESTGSDGASFIVRLIGRFGNGSTIDGLFGENDPGGFIQLGKNSFQTDGNDLIGDSVNILSNSSVFRVLTNNLSTGDNVIIRGGVGTPTLPLQDPFCPIPAIDCTGGVPRSVERNGTVTLMPGTYGPVIVKNRGTLTLSGPGTFTFCSLHTARNSNVIVTGAGQSTINIAGDLRIANGGSLIPAPGSPTPIVNIGGLRVRIGASAVIQAFLSAPNAELSAGRSARLLGTFCVNSSRSDKGVFLGCPPVR